MNSILILLALTLSHTIAKADFVLTMGGDINLAEDEGRAEAPIYSSTDALAPIKQQPYHVQLVLNSEPVFKYLLTGDLNFGNLETVVSSNTQLKQNTKKFTFVTHPDILKLLTNFGFNLFSTANNHIYDYNSIGATDTLENLAALKQKIEWESSVDGHARRSLYHAGLSNTPEEATEPTIIEINGITIAFGAIGFGAVAGGSNEGSIVKDRPGIIALHNTNLVNKLLQNMANSNANLKILSVHNGTEAVYALDPGQKDQYHSFLKRGDLDIIIGHHPHVVRPVENVNGKLIFYSLGNYFMTGAANRDSKGVRGNYGLFSRVYFEQRPDQNRLNGFRLVAEAAELIPITHMHANVSTKKSDEAEANLTDLAKLNFEELGASALAFNINMSSIGVFCGPEIYGPRALKFCPGIEIPTEPGTNTDPNTNSNVNPAANPPANSNP